MIEDAIVVAALRESKVTRGELQARLDMQLDPYVLLAAVKDDSGRIVDFEYTDANEAAIAYNLTTRGDLLGARLLDQLPGHVGAGLLEDYIRTVETGEPLILDDVVYQNEILGADRHYDIRCMKVGDSLAYTWRDVTEVRKALERYRLLAENVSDIVSLIDANGRVEWISPSVKIELGVDPAEIIGRLESELVSPDDLARANEYRQRVLTEEEAEPIEVRLRTAGGGHRWFLAQAQPIRDGAGNLVSVAVTLRDIDREVINRRASATLSAGNAILVNARDEESLLIEMCQAIVDKGGYSFSWYGRAADDDEHCVLSVAMSRERGEFLDDISISWADTLLERDPTGTAIRDGEPVVVDDFAADQRTGPWKERAKQFGLRSAVSLPVRVDGVIDGVLNVYAEEQRAFDDTAVSLLTDLAAQMGVGMERLREHRRLIESLNERMLLATAIDQAGEAVVVTDSTPSIIFANPAAVKSSGYELEEILGKNPSIFSSGLHDRRFYEDLWAELVAGRSWCGVLENQRKSGEIYVEETTISPIHDSEGGLMGYVAVKLDLTVERGLQADLLREQVNRAEVVQLMRDVRPTATLEGTASAFCAAVTNLDAIDAGVILLVQDQGALLPVGIPGSRLEGLLDGSPILPAMQDLLAERTKGGTWWLDLNDPGEITTGPYLEESLKAGFEAFVWTPVNWEGEIIGVLAFGFKGPEYRERIESHLSTFDELGLFAGVLFGEQVNAFGLSESARNEVKDLIEHRRFHPVFQPVIDLKTHEIVGYEALTRFDDDKRPDLHFVEAGSVGLQAELETACAAAALAAAEHLDSELWLSMNFSPTTVVDGHVATVASGSRRIFSIEITEHVRIDDYPALRQAIDQIEGAQLFVDDAGAGYSGLRHILELSPHVVKLDIGLVQKIDTDPARQALVSGMRHFADQTGITLLGEGVETQAEVDTLIALGVDLAQGYFFGYPESLS